MNGQTNNTYPATAQSTRLPQRAGAEEQVRKGAAAADEDVKMGSINDGRGGQAIPARSQQGELRKARGTELVELVVERLETPIRARELRVGEHLPPERQLAAEMGVSRATVREALHELELKGLVERRQGRGTVVIGADRGDLTQHLVEKLRAEDREVLELMDFREAIEAPVAARAARYATRADISALQRVVDRMASTVSRERYGELDSRFHYLVAQASHNALFARLIEWSNEWTLATRSQVVTDTRRRRISLQGHRQILEAIADRDPDRAATAMRDHIRAVTEALTERRTAHRQS
jgi:GntR family transcriptional repressor for pyruvate dehydrogenase complex